jgi:hypothetical protein
MNIIIGARRHSKKCNVPRGSEDKPNDDNSPGKYCRSEKFTDRQ